MDNSVIQSTVEIKEIPGLVKWSEHNSRYHVKSGQQGKMEMTFLASSMKVLLFVFYYLKSLHSDVPAIDSVKEWYLQLELRRTDPKWSHVPVNEVCKNHRQPDSNNTPIQSSVSTDKRFRVEKSASGRIFLFCLCQSQLRDTLCYISSTLCINFPCNDSCGEYYREDI